MKCIHCGKSCSKKGRFTVTYEKDGVSVTNYFCPNEECNKIMSGCLDMDCIKKD